MAVQRADNDAASERQFNKETIVQWLSEVQTYKWDAKVRP